MKKLIATASRTHMPFALRLHGKKYLLLSIADATIGKTRRHEDTAWRRRPPPGVDREKHYAVSYAAWKLHYLDLARRVPVKISTGLPDDAVECSPAAYESGGKVTLTFVGGTWEQERLVRYRLYVMEGPSLDRLSAPTVALETPARAGFRNEFHSVADDGLNGFFVHRQGSAAYFATSFDAILRLSYPSENPGAILVTGSVAGEPRTVLFDVAGGGVREIRSAGAPVYKPTVLGEDLFFAVRKRGDVEDSEVFEHTFELAPTEISVVRREGPSPGRRSLLRQSRS